MDATQVANLTLLAITANIAPVIASLLLGERWNAAIDGSLKLPDQRPLLGRSKTIRGVFSSVLVTSLLAPLFGFSPASGAAFAGLAMLGDLCSSFIKRRLGFAPGHSVPLLDQVPESLLPLWLLQSKTGGTAAEILAATAIFSLVDLVLSRLYKLDRTK